MNDWNYNLAEEALQPVSQAPAEARAVFIRKTYVHLLFAVLAFVGLETLMQMTSAAEFMTNAIMGSGNVGLIVFMLMFIGASWIANSWARSAVSLQKQYMGLSLYVVAEVVIFAPLLFFANTHYEGGHSGCCHFHHDSLRRTHRCGLSHRQEFFVSWRYSWRGHDRSNWLFSDVNALWFSSANALYLLDDSVGLWVYSL